jgi:calpain-15
MGLRRQQGDDDKLLWVSDSGDLHLWHANADCRPEDEWLLTDSPPGSEKMTVWAKVPALGKDDPRSADWKPSGCVESISEVWWDENIAQHDHAWKDPDMPHSKETLGDAGAGHEIIEWIRAVDLERDREHMQLFDGIDPQDLRQGELGNCWLLSAIAVIAEYPKIIEGVFHAGKTLPADGRHAMYLYDVHAESWVCIAIDDYIPCEPRKWFQIHASPVFSKPVGNEMWVLLLEKAFAKYFGGYGNLDGNSPSLAWQALTGSENQLMLEKQKDGSWEMMEANIPLQKQTWKDGARHEIEFMSMIPSKTFDTQSFVAYLEDCRSKDYVMSASIDGDSVEVIEGKGLVQMHAYSIIQVCRIGDVHLVELRNPWGHGVEWTGRWSDNDSAWDEMPHVKQAVNHKADEDGTFWMSADDFATEFDTVYACPTSMAKRGSIVKRAVTRAATGMLELQGGDGGHSNVAGRCSKCSVM